MRRLAVRSESWPIRGVFTISRGSMTEARVVVAEIADGDAVGRGECVPYARNGATVPRVLAEIEGLGAAVADGLNREHLQGLLPAGSARNALDCALWDLEAKLARAPAWRLAGLPEPTPLVTAFTLGLDAPAAMADAARANAQRPLLKLKLGAGGSVERVRAVREAAPGARLIVDANEAWTPEVLADALPALAALGVEMLEQPLPAGDDAVLAGLDRLMPVCADESCHDVASLAGLEGRYDMVNIKLDKTGGLTEALALKAEAERMGFDVMVGCMLASSLAMAPAVLVAQGVEIVDLDGPLLLAADRDNPLKYDADGVHPPTPELWG